MRVLFVSAEVSPYAKVGGLADVAGSLPKALIDQGHDVRVVMPAYGLVVEDPAFAVERLGLEFFVRVNDSRFVRAELFETRSAGFPVWLVDGEHGGVGGSPIFRRARTSQEVYSFHRDDYLFFCQAALEACQDTGWWPDVVHCHDWHTGLLPAMLKHTRGGDWEKVATVFTIHNFAYQGEFGFDTLAAAGLSTDFFHPDWAEAYGSVNFLKTGTVFADEVNTVSPNYAREIQTPEFGCRLEGLMAHLHARGRLHGILNGIDMEVWNPLTDPALAAGYSVEDLSGKAVCRAALVSEAGLTVGLENPVLGAVTRLSHQKGLDLVVEAAHRMVGAGAALVVQGLGDPWIAGELRRLEEELPGRVKFFPVFDAPLAQRIYAGCDGFLMPSAFEPCGLGQMFAMRYGTVPVVRHTGGLADTVFEGENGFVFQHSRAEELAAAVERLVSVFREPLAWAELQRAGMSADFSWEKSARAYGELYGKAVKCRRGAGLVAGRGGRR